MANCIYCGEKAGFFKDKHPKCHSFYLEGCDKFRSVVADGAIHMDISRLKSDMSAIYEKYRLETSQARLLTIEGWECAVSVVLDDHLLTEDEEKGLMTVSSAFALSQEDLDGSGCYTRVAQAALLRDLAEGNKPNHVTIVGGTSFNYQKSEFPIWEFPQIDYYEDKTRRETVGRSSGVSVRVAKGVYFRTGASRGHSVEYTDTLHRGSGTLVITNKHLYFGGSGLKALRVRHDKIVSVEQFTDGIEIHRDAVTAKPQKFIGCDGWFLYNLMMNASNV